MNAKEMREKRALTYATQMRALVDAVKKEDRGLNTEERTRWDYEVTEIGGIPTICS